MGSVQGFWISTSCHTGTFAHSIENTVFKFCLGLTGNKAAKQSACFQAVDCLVQAKDDWQARRPWSGD
jgi:hypothetical protein